MQDLFSLKGCVAIVTGAGRGNGFGIAKGLHKFGAEIYSIDLQHIHNVEEDGFHQIVGDVTDEKLQAEICEKAYAQCERTPILVNNAGISMHALFEDCEMTIGSFNDPEKRQAREAHMMIKRWGTPEDLVGAAVFLSSDASTYVTGQDINVDGGWTANGLM